jgi:hypothetical protein
VTYYYCCALLLHDGLLTLTAAGQSARCNHALCCV